MIPVNLQENVLYDDILTSLFPGAYIVSWTLLMSTSEKPK